MFPHVGKGSYLVQKQAQKELAKTNGACTLVDFVESARSKWMQTGRVRILSLPPLKDCNMTFIEVSATCAPSS